MRFVAILLALTLGALPATAARRASKTTDDDIVPVPIPSLPSPPRKGGRPAPTKKPAGPRDAAKPSERLRFAPFTAPVLAGEAAVLSITATDASGRRANVPLRVTADIGTVTNPVQVDVGEYTSVYRAPGNAPPGGVAIVTASVATPAGKVLFSTDLRITFGDPTELPIAGLVDFRPTDPGLLKLVSDDRPSVEAGQRTTVAFRLEDRDGRPATTEGLSLSTSGGTFSRVRRGEGTGYVADFRADDSASGEVAFRAQVGDRALEGAGAVLVTPSRPRPPRVPTTGLAGFVGGQTNLGTKESGGTSSVEVLVVFDMPVALPSLRLGVATGYLPATASASSGPRRAILDITFVPVFARAAWVLSAGALDLYVGALGGVAWASVTIRPEGAATQKASGLRFGGGFFGGVAFPLGPGAALLEIRSTGTGNALSGDATVRLALGTLSGAVGYRFDL